MDSLKRPRRLNRGDRFQSIMPPELRSKVSPDETIVLFRIGVN